MENKSIAIFIDAENIPAKYAKNIFDIASDYGEIIIKRIYGDWTQKNIQNWKEQIAQYALIAMQQFNFTANKNSSDMYLITEVMSVFYEKNEKLTQRFEKILSQKKLNFLTNSKNKERNFNQHREVLEDGRRKNEH